MHVGPLIGIEQGKNLYGLVLGNKGKQLVERRTKLNEEIETCRGKAKAEKDSIESALRPYQEKLRPETFSFERFLESAPAGDFSEKIKRQERVIATATEASEVANQATFVPFTLPQMPVDFIEVLSSTLSELSPQDQKALNEHIEKHGLDKNEGMRWLEHGMDFTHSGSCPLCARGLDGLDFYRILSAFFSDKYDALNKRLLEAHSKFDLSFNDT